MLLTVPMSLWDILMHLIYYSKPSIQRHIIRVLWLVPIYSTESWLALRNDNDWYGEAFQVIRESYEGFVIYSFFNYLVASLGGTRKVLEKLGNERREHMHHMAPCGCSDPCLGIQGRLLLISEWTDPRDFLHNIKMGVFQYVFLQLVCTCATLIMLSCFSSDLFAQSEGFTFKNGYSYVSIVLNLSQCWAIYCLVLFYHSFMGDPAFEASKPFGKFISVKGLVFFTFWQSMGLDLLVQYGIIKASPQGFWSAIDVKAGLQDFTLCIEMFFFAIAHKYCFTYEPFKVALETPNTPGHDRASHYENILSATPDRRRSTQVGDRSLKDNFLDMFNGQEVTTDALGFRDVANRNLVHPLKEGIEDLENEECCSVCSRPGQAKPS